MSIAMINSTLIMLIEALIEQLRAIGDRFSVSREEIAIDLMINSQRHSGQSSCDASLISFALQLYIPDLD